MIHIAAPYDLVVVALIVCTMLRVSDSLLFHNKLRDFAIEPRTVPGLFGVPIAPFLHANWAHFASNIVPLTVLGSLTAYESPRAFALCGLAGIGSGLATWLFARPSRHLGASGVAYTFFGYLLAAGYYNRALILVSLGVWLLFGRLMRGVLPQRKGISFEAHLFGFFAGVAVAAYRSRLLSMPLVATAARWAGHHVVNVESETGVTLVALTVCLLAAARANASATRHHA